MIHGNVIAMSLGVIPKVRLLSWREVLSLNKQALARLDLGLTQASSSAGNHISYNGALPFSSQALILSRSYHLTRCYFVESLLRVCGGLVIGKKKFMNQIRSPVKFNKLGEGLGIASMGL